MKKQTIFWLLVCFAPSWACQSLSSSGAGTVISDCIATVSAIENIQPEKIPNDLRKTGIKQGDEFDANQYFGVLNHVSMREGYILDYVYHIDDLGAFPMLYARPMDQTPYVSAEGVSADTKLPDFREYVVLEDIEQGYFEYAVLNIMAGQFYLDWHANYNDTEIVCNRESVDDIIFSVNEGNIGSDLNLTQQAKARAIKNIEPVVTLTKDAAVVRIVAFSKWGGFFRLTYTIRREVPHIIIDVKEEELVPYDCGVMF